MSDAHACCCPLAQDATSLHEKLHAMEAVRAKEMHAHGQLVQQLQTQLSARSQNEKELQLTVAKLRAEKCRLDAETSSNLTKLRGLEERGTSAERQHERWAEDYRQRLLVKDDEIARLVRTIEALKTEQHEASLVDAKRTTHACSMKREMERITDERDHARLASTSSAQDVSQLASRLAAKQAELDAERKKTEQMHKDLDTQSKELANRERQIQTLTRTCERLETTRLRLAAWGRVRVDLMERDVRFRDMFLEWKAQTLTTKATRSREIQREAQQRLEKLGRVRKDLDGKLRATYNAFETTKAWLQLQRDDIRVWKEICKAQFSSVILTRVQHERTETNRVCDEKVTALNAQLQSEKAQHVVDVVASRVLVQNLEATRKRHVDALLERIQILHMQQLRAYAFQGWKDQYVRNIVAETSHAVMVARAAQALVAAPPRNRLRAADSTTASKSTLRSKLPVSSPPELEPKSNLPARQPQLVSEPFANDSEEEQWKRWRRVAPTGGTCISASTTRRSSLTSSASTTPSTPPSTIPAHGTKSNPASAPSTSSQRRGSLF